MPALPAVPKVIRVALIHSYGEDNDVVTRFFVSYSGTAPTAAQLNTYAAAMITNWGTDLKSLCNAQVKITECVVEDLSSPTSAIGAAVGSTAGTLAGATLTGGTAFVVSYTIARRYRGGHPRGYWPFGDAVTLNDPQTWTAGFTGNVNADLGAFFTDALAAGWTGAGTLLHVNVSYYEGFTVVTNPITGRARNVPTLRATPLVDTVTGIVARTQVGSQRRRN
jgi:hypothetical protein